MGLFSRLEQLGLGRPPLKAVKLSMPQFGLLACIWRQPGIRVHEAAEKLGVTMPTVSVALRKLEKEGWLRRKVDPQDRRSALLYLSPKASILARQVGGHRRRRINEFMDGLTPKEQEQLFTLLEKAITNLEEKRTSTQEETRRPLSHSRSI